MGGFDVYCAFCGALAASPPLFEDDEVEEQGTYDEKIVTPDSIVWMDHVRLIGENAECPLPSKIYISGRAHGDDGYFEVEQTDDPHFFEEGQPGHESLLAYTFYEDSSNPLALPFHEACYDLFKKQVGLENLDLDLLYQVLKEVFPADKEHRCHLSIDYGSISECQGQYWCTFRGTEVFVADPQSIPRLQDYWNNVPQIRAVEDWAQPATINTVQDSGKDLFALLPPEMIMHITSYMDIRSALRLRTASRAAGMLALDQAFWKGRITRDMSWLYDLPIQKIAEGDQIIDFCQIYKDLLLASDLKSEAKIHGLANRRRIWEIMYQVTDLYLEAVSENRQLNFPILADAESTAMYRLTHDEPRSTRTIAIPLIKDVSELVFATPTISVHWNSSGELTGLGTRPGSKDEGASGYVIGDAGTFSSIDECTLPADDWLTAVILTINQRPTLVNRPNEESRAGSVHQSIVGVSLMFAHQDALQFGTCHGIQRLIAIEDYSIVVGFMGQWSKGDGLLRKLALLYLDRPEDSSSARTTSSHDARHSLTILSYQWKDHLLPPTLSVVQPVSGYQCSTAELDPMEYLLFGVDDDSRSDMTAVGGDYAMGGFEVHYRNRPTTFIGPRHDEMKYLPIDGAGGERITTIGLSTGHEISGIRFVTNRDRQLVIGVPTEYERRFVDGQLPGPSSALAGIYCSWSHSGPRARARAIGVINRSMEPVDNTIDGDIDIAASPRRLLWEPSPPPCNIKPIDHIWGRYELYNQYRRETEYHPPEGSLTSWLDCRRPLKSVEVVLCHDGPADRLPVAGLTFEYADDSLPGTSSIGPSCSRGLSSNVESNEQAQSHYEPRGDKGREHHSKPLLSHERFEARNSVLQQVRVWLNKNDALCGLQIISADGRESPRWGHGTDCEPAGSIDLAAQEVGGNAHVVGLKCFMNKIIDGLLLYDDVVIVGIQALVEE